ncbi:MAG: ABC transporter permease [Saccharospirillum sp.]
MTGHWLAWFPRLALLVFLTPVVVGLLGTGLPAFGWFPALGERHFSLDPWRDLLAYPGFGTALRHSLITGLGSSLMALVLTFCILAAFYPSRGFQKLERWLAPILSVPHAAFAIGLGFLIAPSGWLFRLSESLTGWPLRPLNWLTFQDPWGISLTLTLTLKETPFLLFMALASLPSLRVRQTLWLGASLGYGRTRIWLLLIAPALFKRLTLPLFAVIAYGLSVVDVALLAGPTAPPTLAVLVHRLFNAPDVLLRLPGAAGASLLLLVTLASLGMVTLLARVSRCALPWLLNGRRYPESPWLTLSGWLSLGLGLFAYLGATATLLLWSLTGQWRFPAAWPVSWSLDSWDRALGRMGEAVWLTFSTGMTSAVIAVILVIGALENEVRLGHKPGLRSQRLLWLLYVPLLVPQLAFLFGVQVSLIWLGLDGRWWVLVWSHLVFVLPYCFLTLSSPYRAFDARYTWVGLSLSQSPLRTWWRVKMALLWRPIGYTLATGFAVSVAQYLPTLFVGGGRFATITTEAVSLASGSDRRITAVYALMQQALPLLVFLLALALPAWRYRHRQELLHHG